MDRYDYEKFYVSLIVTIKKIPKESTQIEKKNESKHTFTRQ